MHKNFTSRHPERNLFAGNISLTEDESSILEFIARHFIGTMPLHETEYQALKSFLKKIDSEVRQ